MADGFVHSQKYLLAHFETEDELLECYKSGGNYQEDGERSGFSGGRRDFVQLSTRSRSQDVDGRPSPDAWDAQVSQEDEDAGVGDRSDLDRSEPREE
jgi:hypothetical protein